MSDKRPRQKNPGCQFNLDNSDNRPDWPTVANEIEGLLDGVAANLDMARRLAGRSVKIPTWGALIWTWHHYQRRALTRSFPTQTDGENIGGAVMSQSSQLNSSTIPIPGQVTLAATANEERAYKAVQVTLDQGVKRSFATQTDGQEIGLAMMSQSSQTDSSPIPIPGQVSAKATANKQLAHKAVQVALDREVVMLHTKKTRQSRPHESAPYQTQWRIRETSEYQKRDRRSPSVPGSVSPSARRPSIKMKLTRLVPDAFTQGAYQERQNKN